MIVAATIRPTAPSADRVCIDDLHYNEDGTLKRVVQTSEGIALVQRP
jgi:hypothetical protein